MSSIRNYFEKAVSSARQKSNADIASMIFIVFGVAALLILLSPH